MAKSVFGFMLLVRFQMQQQEEQWGIFTTRYMQWKGLLISSGGTNSLHLYIEQNVVNAKEYISGGTNSLHYSKQMKKKNRMWVYLVWAVRFIILLVCFISVLNQDEAFRNLSQ